MPAARPLRSDGRYFAHALLDRVGGDPAAARRALDDATAERAAWADRDHGAAS